MGKSPHIETRRLGDVTLTVVDSGITEWHPAYNAPRSEWVSKVAGIDADGWIPLHTNALHIRTSQASIVVDPCQWHPAQLQAWPNVRLKKSYPGVDAALLEIGSSPKDVSHVIMTHSHFDHCSGAGTQSPMGWKLTYPNATHVLNRLDYPTTRTGSGVVYEVLSSVAESGKLQLITGPHEVVEGVVLVPAPGETPGHMVVQVTLAGQTLIYAGDLFHFPFELEHVDWIPEGRNLDETVTSRTAVIDLVDATGASMMFTHADFPGWGTCYWTEKPHATWIPD
jgi:glyoxylase-like metal-dependent hydrolase (beta-lactamase superfamily II)